LPQTLGGYPTDEIVNTVTKANNILTAACGTCGCGCDKTMRAKLKGQLLAMKFNIAHFGIGDYEYEGRTLDDIVAEADDLLRDLSTPDPILEEMKNLLDYLNDLHQIRFCRIPPPQIEEYIVVNEVYYDVKCHGEEGWNEWVEIYNPTDNPVDISGWKIADNGGEDTIPSSDSIPPDGFAVITPKASTWSKWPSIPSGAIKIVLESKIGNGLANDGDRVILRMPDGTEIDAISYGSDTYAFDPSVPDVAEGHSIARYPKGFDTDQASDWIDLSWPNPGTNPHASDEALIGMEGEIGCAEGQVYVPEERDTSEDPEEVVPEENQEESTQEEAAENSEEATEGETTTETPEPETPEETISGGTPQEIPVEEIPTEDIPGEETPTEEPAEETPEETPNEELPPEETLTEEMPTEDETQTPAVIPEDELTELSESNTSENPTESNPETSTETPTETPSEVPPETPTETSDSVPEI